MSQKGPEAVPQRIVNFIVTSLTDATIYVQDAYNARQENARRKEREEADREAREARRRVLGYNADNDDGNVSLMGDLQAEQGRRHQE
jgi:hypothetical protein